MPAIVVQLGILGQQILGIVRQIECGVVAQSLDAQHLAQAQHRIKAGAAYAVVQRTVHCGKGNTYRKGKLADTLVLLADLFADDLCQVIHCFPSFTLTFL